LGILETIRNALSSPPGPPPLFADRWRPSPVTRGALDPDRVPEWFSRSPNWTDWDDAASLADAVAKCTVMFACSTYLADAIAESPLEVYKTIDGEKDVAEDRFVQPCRDLLTAPNPYTSGSEFNLLLVLVMSIHGYGVIEKVRAGSGLPVQLWLLRPDWLVRRQRMSSGERYWEYRGSFSDRRDIPDRDVVVVPYYPDPRMERRGLSPGQVAAREVGIDSGLTDFLKTFLDAGGIPPFVLTHPDPVYDDAVITAMQEKWRQKYGGSRAYGALPVLHGGYAIQEIGGSLDEMAWPDLRGLTEQKIAQAYRVPWELIQGQMAMKGGKLTSTEFEGAMTLLQRYGAAPLRARIDGALTRGVLAEFTGGDPAYDLAFDTDGILALQEDTDALHARVRSNYQSGIITLAEARQDLGMPELPNKQGDVIAVPFSLTLTPITSLVETETTTTTPPPALPAKSGRQYRDTKALSPRALELRAGVLDRTRKDRKRLAEIGTRALRKFWTEQGERITAEITGKGVVIVRAVQDIDWSEEERKLADVLLRYYHANGEAAFKATADLLRVEIAWDLANPNVQRVAADLARRIVGIAETTRQDVSRIVGDALTEGVTIQDLSDRLKGLFTETYRNRSMAVARTESMVAYSRASLVAYQESGEVDEVELHDNPSHTDSYGASDGLTCAERDGLIVPITTTERHIHAEHPNGSLAVSPILATPLGEE
jgi:HK97 family phage portal protein